MKLNNLKREVESLKDLEKARLLQRFFKTGKGEYGEGDVFYGLTVPQSRKIVNKYKELGLDEVIDLLHSEVHEERLIALLILVSKYQKGDFSLKKKIFDVYLKNTKWINNWDLVDLSAHKIVGDYLVDKDIEVLKKLACSNSLWERRIAIISTFAFINIGSSKETIEIAKILVADKHDLIHKAVGWALREVGKRVSVDDEKRFLDKYKNTMPRTMLRYSIERFSEKERKSYLKK